MTTGDAFEPDQRYAANATSFGAAAEVYERGRPSYPATAVDWLLPEGAHHVLDLGAGTGKLTRMLVDRVPLVTAVEPSEGMREQLVRSVPGAQALPGSAERLPLDGESVDAIFAAQAWHWVDVDRAVPEAARVLRPGGVLALLWNIRIVTDPWMIALDEIIAPASESDAESESPRVGPPFSEIERRDFEWVNEITPDEVIDMVASRSYILTLPEGERLEQLERVRTLLATHPDTAGRATVGVPYVTRCSKATLAAE
ncbi:methyltransferase family protein [Frondihabitans sp. PhB188]|uniref:class I SAM-dependent methyltransferase n=1 Tax=Frondihabitans sp. PhB188 TaxID=2485200 RepID=UPI000F4AAFC8|nr:class I SAM-dependent methyltransferase [Frondihabitans sp. PhB188]ROQ38618.1 methyltransferase family protein [Frondihabitans sp. PhB188]